MSSGSVRLEVVFGGVTALLRVAAGVCAYFPSPPPEGVEGCDMVVTCEGGRKEGEEGGKEGGEVRVNLTWSAFGLLTTLLTAMHDRPVCKAAMDLCKGDMFFLSEVWSPENHVNGRLGGKGREGKGRG